MLFEQGNQINFKISPLTPQRPRGYISRVLGFLLLFLVPVFIGVSFSNSSSSSTAVVASQVFRRLGGIVSGLTGVGRASSSLSPAATMTSTERLTPVYFVSHGGVRLYISRVLES